MWRSLWGAFDRFSLRHFRFLTDQLRDIKVVDENNKELVIDILQSIVEIVIHSDKHDPQTLEYFMDSHVLAEFVRLLKIGGSSSLEAPLLQYLSIMIQNIDNEYAICYCFSNDYINSVIAHQFKFDKGDITSYYVSFLRAVSNKVNRDTLCLLVKVNGNAVVSFPLYSEAIKFAHNEEKMIQTAIRALTLRIYHVSDETVIRYIISPTCSNYFSNLIQNVKENCIHMDSLAHATDQTHNHGRREDLISEADKFTDELYYFKDIISVGKSCLTALVTRSLFSLLVLPLLLPSVQLRPSDGSDVSAITSFYVVTRLLQVIGGENLVNSVAKVVLYAILKPNVKDAAAEDIACKSGHSSSLSKLSDDLESMGWSCDCSESSNDVINYLSGISTKEAVPEERLT